jgi:hypothetical protein
MVVDNFCVDHIRIFQTTIVSIVITVTKKRKCFALDQKDVSDMSVPCTIVVNMQGYVHTILNIQTLVSVERRCVHVVMVFVISIWDVMHVQIVKHRVLFSIKLEHDPPHTVGWTATHNQCCTKLVDTYLQALDMTESRL